MLFRGTLVPLRYSRTIYGVSTLPPEYLRRGRVRQKLRTRDALIEAARDLVTRGVTPSVEETAEAAGVSRTTAYRYFPDQTALLAAAHPEIGAASLLDDTESADPVERLAVVLEHFIAATIQTEAQQRLMLRLSLDPDRAPSPLPLRQGRAIGWFTEALEPLRSSLGDDMLHRLVLAIRSAVGIESLSWLTDVAGLSRPEAVELMTWSAQALLRDAMSQADPT